MKKKLKHLFDYQKFERNSKLDEVVLGVDLHYADSLSDVQLERVNAAGNVAEQQTEETQKSSLQSSTENIQPGECPPNTNSQR